MQQQQALITTFSFRDYCGTQPNSAITLEGEVWMPEAQLAHAGPFLMAGWDCEILPD